MRSSVTSNVNITERRSGKSQALIEQNIVQNGQINVNGIFYI